MFNTGTNSSLTGTGCLIKMRLFFSYLCQSFQTAKAVKAGFSGQMCLVVDLSEGGEAKSRVLLIDLPLPVSMCPC